MTTIDRTYLKARSHVIESWIGGAQGGVGGKIQAIKALREVTNFGLKESKDFIDQLPNPHDNALWVVEGQFDTLWDRSNIQMTDEWRTKHHDGVPFLGMHMPSVTLDLTPILDVLMGMQTMLTEQNELLGDLIHLISEGD